MALLTLLNWSFIDVSCWFIDWQDDKWAYRFGFYPTVSHSKNTVFISMKCNHRLDILFALRFISCVPPKTNSWSCSASILTSSADNRSFLFTAIEFLLALRLSCNVCLTISGVRTFRSQNSTPIHPLRPPRTSCRSQGIISEAPFNPPTPIWLKTTRRKDKRKHRRPTRALATRGSSESRQKINESAFFRNK